MMKMMKLMRLAGLAVLASAATAFFSGCENGGSSGGDGGGGGGGSVEGVWVMSDGKGWTSYWEFRSDGVFIYFNDSNLTSEHLRGTYTKNGNKVKGPFTNPGVGTGEIDCTVSGNTMAMDFIEHWHTPYKHVPLNGTKR